MHALLALLAYHARPVAPNPLETIMTLAWIFGAIVFIFVFVAPVTVKQSVKQSAQADLVLLEPGQADPTAPLDAPRERMKALGFEYVATLRYAGTGGHAQIWIVLMKNKAERDLGLAVMVFKRQPGTVELTLAGQHVEFVSKFGEDASLTTSNSAIMPVFASVPGKQIERFPMVTEERLLYRLHRRLVEPFGEKNKGRVTDEDPVTLLRNSIRREMEGQVRTGFFQLDPAQNCYVPTWKGAYLMTWKMLPPVKQLRRALRDRRDRGLIRELGENVA